MNSDEILEVLNEHLQTQDEIEIILLKGHLILEKALNELLSVHITNRRRIDSLNLGFARKLELVAALHDRPPFAPADYIEQLKALNRIRNKLGHELDFQVYHDDLKRWACEVLQYTPKTLNRKRTYRSTLLKAIYLIAGEMFGEARGRKAAEKQGSLDP